MLFEIKFTNAYMSFASVNQATVIVQRSYEPGVVSETITVVCVKSYRGLCKRIKILLKSKVWRVVNLFFVFITLWFKT